MRRTWTMGWCLTFAATTFPMVAQAADYIPVGHRRPRSYSTPCCPTCPTDGMPSGVPTPSTQQPTTPDGSVEPQPGDMPQAEAQSPAPNQDAADLPSFGNLALAEQGMGGGAGTMILGRADAVNRFNLFDNMGAEPVSRVWATYQNIQGLNPNVPRNPALGRPDQHLYRFGVEYAFSECTSFAAQGMFNNPYNTGVGIGALEDSWSNPQLLVKRVLGRTDFTTISGTLGLEIEVETQGSTLNEQYSRIQPGLLMYHDLDRGYYTQLGAMLDVPLADNATTTASWVVSLGKWLYRHDSMDSCNSGGCASCSESCGDCGSKCCLPWVIGITGQIDLLGKHVTGDATIRDGFFITGHDPYNGSSNVNAVVLQSFDIEEARHIIDMTIGTNILFKNDTALGLGFSFPISEDEVRKSEFIVSYNWFL